MLPAIAGPPHAAALQACLHDVLRRGLDVAAADGQAHRNEVGVAHSSAVVAEVDDGVCDDLRSLAAWTQRLPKSAHGTIYDFLFINLDKVLSKYSLAYL